MKFRWIRNNLSTIKFIVSLAIVSIIIGFILYNNQTPELKKVIIEKVGDLSINITSTNQNNILFHLGLLSILTILSLILIGLPIGLIYYFYEFVSIGYLLSSLFNYKKLNGLLFGSIFVIINKMLFLLLLSYFLINTINYTKKYLKSLKLSKKDLIINYLYKCFFVILIVFLNDIIIYYLGNKITSIFLFLL